MAVTNGYITVSELRQWLMEKQVYTATTISFTVTSNIIADTGYGLGFLEVGDIFTITGTDSNDGTYTVSAKTNAGSITTTEALATEAAGDTVVVTQIYSKASAVRPENESQLEDIIEGASRAIDMATGRQWYADSETRYYLVGQDTDGRVLTLDKPLLTVTSVTNADSESLTENTDYVLRPVNADAYSKIILTLDSGTVWQYSTDPEIDTISVAGTWGDSSTVDHNVRTACKLWTARLWKRKDAIFGVSGTSALGVESIRQVPIDPDIKKLLPGRMPIGYGYK